jgi:hypothetical protein
MTMYLLCLEFRTPPFNVQFQYPNSQVSVPIILDGAFSFLDRFMDMGDWREDYLVKVSKPIEHLTPRIQTSYMFPAIQKAQVVEFLTPSDTCLAFEIDGDATLKWISDEDSDIDITLTPFSLRLRRQFDLDKVLGFLDSLESLEIEKKKRNISALRRISERRGPYKSISIDVHVKASHLFWCAFADAEDLNMLEGYLESLKITGIGKKRNMGWGDLKKYEIHKVQQDTSIYISTDKLVYQQNNESFIETIRPKQLKEVQELIRGSEKGSRRDNKYALVKFHIGQGTTTPPYWGKETIAYNAKLVKGANKPQGS